MGQVRPGKTTGTSDAITPLNETRSQLSVENARFGVLESRVAKIMNATIHSDQTTGSWSIAEISRTAEGKALLHRALDEITKGAAFKGSHRSAQFLEYVVHQSALGHLDALKERVIGVELFGRVPSYDTGEDAVVRVTASDVRKRLLQHYSGNGNTSEFRIMLPSGGYVPELVRDTSHREHKELSEAAVAEPAKESAAATVSTPAPAIGQPEAKRLDWRDWVLPLLGTGALICGIVLSGIGLRRHLPSPDIPSRAPWAAMFSGAHPVLIVASDPNIEEIQRLAKTGVTLSDYANQHYLPQNAGSLPAEEVAFMRDILRGNKISTFDGEIIAGITSLMPRNQSPPAVKGARDIRVPDLETDGDLVFLGSPRSNPWTSMYDPLLDFRFAFDDQTHREFVQDVHPGKGEKSVYTPSAGGFGTGDSYATISFFQNPGHTGQILMIAGANGEGTEAAGALVTDPTRWDSLLSSCNLPKTPSGVPVQLLLHLGTLAGSASDVQVVSCHVLGSTAR